ncbi:MAG: hypothetical protein LUP97_02080 [Methanoregula sp.]|nr:hypothetical protein [Methanoregula sp.]
MKGERCVSVTDAGGMGLANGVTEPENQRGNYGFVVTAGALIGLGAGWLVDNVGTGILIGIGVGLLVSELIPYIRRPRESVGLSGGNVNVTTLLIGAFLVFAGISIVVAPGVLWPYAIPVFLILLGIWSLVRGFSPNR